MADLKKVHLLGVEIEGAWRDHPPSATIKHDGSVKGLDGLKGEVCSKPSRIVEIPPWMKDNYPHAVNQTCGLHVHYSFEDMRDYGHIMDPEFQEFFLERMGNWGVENRIPEDHPFWSRLKGENRYCYKEHIPDAQFCGGGHKYTQWNFQAWRRHGTVECRMLPAFDRATTSIKSVEDLSLIVDDYLTKRPETGVFVFSFGESDIESRSGKVLYDSSEPEHVVR